jgi:hypothetical protein
MECAGDSGSLPPQINFFRSLTFGLSVIVIKRNGYAKSVELRLINTGH